MIPYSANLKARMFEKISPADAQRIIDEFQRIEIVLRSVQKDLAVPRRRPFSIMFHHGDTATSTTNTTEPTQFGGAGVLLQRFRSVDVDTIRGSGRFVTLRLRGTLTASNSGGANTTSVKLFTRFQPVTTVRSSETQRVVGTTPTLLRFDYDLMPFIDTFINGDCFGAFAVWGSAAGTSTIGAGSTSNPNSSLEIYGEVEE